jgi:hypothetical protein
LAWYRDGWPGIGTVGLVSGGFRKVSLVGFRQHTLKSHAKMGKPLSRDYRQPVRYASMFFIVQVIVTEVLTDVFEMTGRVVCPGNIVRFPSRQTVMGPRL